MTEAECKEMVGLKAMLRLRTLCHDVRNVDSQLLVLSPAPPTDSPSGPQRPAAGVGEDAPEAAAAAAGSGTDTAAGAARAGGGGAAPVGTASEGGRSGIGRGKRRGGGPAAAGSGFKGAPPTAPPLAHSPLENGLRAERRFNHVHYLKGYFFLHHLRSLIGYEKMDAVLATFAVRHANRHVSSADFLTFLVQQHPEIHGNTDAAAWVWAAAVEGGRCSTVRILSISGEADDNITWGGGGPWSPRKFSEGGFRKGAPMTASLFPQCKCPKIWWGGCANAETTPAGAPAAAADRTQRPDATCEGKTG